ncbi:MAG: hypothetical protein RML46_09950 [Anaerolineae bacterium]|nr:hypothetical protein [Anaerolineae bacterium]
MKKLLLVPAMFILAFGVFIFNEAPLLQRSDRTPGNIPNTPDEKEIQQTIERAYELEEIAARTFNTTEFAEVFINDPRGGKLDDSTLRFIEEVYGTDLTSAGYPDYKIAYYKWWASGARKIEALQSKAQAEGRPLSPEELSSLIDSSGRIAMPRAQGPIQKVNLQFHSISIEGDTAVVIFDDGPRTNRTTLVKVNGRWYIAGNKILAVHP